MEWTNKVKEEIKTAPSNKVSITLDNGHIWYIQYDHFRRDKILWVHRCNYVCVGVTDAKTISTIRKINWIVDNDDGKAYEEIVEKIINSYSPRQTIMKIEGV